MSDINENGKLRILKVVPNKSNGETEKKKKPFSNQLSHNFWYDQKLSVNRGMFNQEQIAKSQLKSFVAYFSKYGKSHII